jgi:hypothetical protein
MSQWSTEWPVRVGSYWFYGWRTKGRDCPPVLFFVEARMMMWGIVYVTANLYLSPSDGSAGLWLPAEAPQPPDLKEVEKLLPDDKLGLLKIGERTDEQQLDLPFRE